MGCSDRYDLSEEEIVREKRVNKCRELCRQLRKLSSSKFTVDEIMLITQANASQYKTDYYTQDMNEIEKLAKRILRET